MWGEGEEIKVMITALLLQLMLVDPIGGGTVDYDYTIIRGNRAFSLDYY